MIFDSKKGMVPLVLDDGKWLEKYQQTASSSSFEFLYEDSASSALIFYNSVSLSYTSTPASPYRSTWGARRDPLYIVIPVTIIYALIFLTGVIGNVSTCIVIARNKSMHTATNYYLFSLAVSDLLLLVSGLPPEMYYIWSHFPYIFGEVFCVIQGFAAETSANATVLTITAFTIERYVAICHPFLSHTMSRLTRAIKFVIGIWLVALCLAIPQAMSVGIVYETLPDGKIPYEDHYVCVVKRVVIPHAFEISTFLFFVAPMTLITVLYVLIGLQLRRSSIIARGGTAGSSVSLKTRGIFKRKERTSTEVVAVMLPDNYNHRQVNNDNNQSDDGRKNYSKNVQNKAAKHVVKMLVAVVVAFFICWAPFHAQRLLAIYGKNNAPHTVAVFNILTYISGVLYYLSTTINPLLYHIMSNKFREAFKETLARCCGRGHLAKRRRRAGVGGKGAPEGVGRCYSILSGRFSQNNSTSGGSNGGGCYGIEDDGGGGIGVDSFRYNLETEVTSLREFRRPLVVSFRRRHFVSSSKLQDTSPQTETATTDELENELQEALANLEDEGKSRYPIFRSRRIDLESRNRNNLSLHVVCRESPHLETEMSRETVKVLVESGHQKNLSEPKIQNRFKDVEVEESNHRPRITNSREFSKGKKHFELSVSSNPDSFANVEDIEIFHEQRFVMSDLKRSSRILNNFENFSTPETRRFDSNSFLDIQPENTSIDFSMAQIKPESINSMESSVSAH